MNTYATKTQESKSQSVGNVNIQKQSGGESTFLFVDKRPEAITQRKLQEIANKNPKPTLQIQNNLNINDDDLENKAPRMQAKALAFNGRAGVKIGNEQGYHSQTIQRKRIDKAVTGITHLVKMVNGTLYGGNELNEVSRGDYVVIDSEGYFDSRRGPNQEVDTNREADRSGPQHYTWYPVITLNGVEMGPNVFIRKDTIANLQEKEIGKEAAWLTFGVDGKNLVELKSAVSKGYRRFDCAEGYRNTKDVAKALKEKKVPRNEVEIIYKFDLQTGEKREVLLGRLMPVIQMFGGRLDVLMIHNVTRERNEMTLAWGVMNELKTTGHVGRVGMGNIKADQAHLLKELSDTAAVDIVENSATSVLPDQELQNLIKTLGADLTYYDVIDLAKEIVPFDTMETSEKKNTIEALVFRLQKISDNTGFKSHMILSSRNSERQQSNLEMFGKGTSRTSAPEKDEDVADYITFWKNRKNVCDKNGPEVVMPDTIATFLAKTDWTVLRKTISESGQEISDYLVAHNSFSKKDLQAVTVPERKGLKRRYVEWSLDYILEKLLGTVTCEHQPALELISTLTYKIETWNLMKGYLNKIV